MPASAAVSLVEEERTVVYDEPVKPAGYNVRRRFGSKGLKLLHECMKHSPLATTGISIPLKSNDGLEQA